MVLQKNLPTHAIHGGFIFREKLEFFGRMMSSIIPMYLTCKGRKTKKNSYDVSAYDNPNLIGYYWTDTPQWICSVLCIPVVRLGDRNS